MGIVYDVIERFRAGEEERPFECLQCGTCLDLEYHICPACGSFSIDRRMSTL